MQKSTSSFDLEIKRANLTFPPFKYILAVMVPHYSQKAEPCYISNKVYLQDETFAIVHTLAKKVINNGFCDPVISTLRSIHRLFDLHSKNPDIVKIKVIVHDYLIFLHVSGQIRQNSIASDVLWRKIRLCMKKTGIRLEVELGRDWPSVQKAFSTALRLNPSFLGTKERLRLAKNDFKYNASIMEEWIKQQNRSREFGRYRKTA